MNAIIAAPGPATLYMPGPDSNFSNSIENNLVEFSISLAIQNPCPTIPEFTWPTSEN